MKRKYILTFVATVLTIVVLLSGCGPSPGKAVSVEGESIAGSTQSAEETGNSKTEDPNSPATDWSGGESTDMEGFVATGEQGSRAGNNAPEAGSHPDLLSRTTHQSLFQDMAVQGNVVELQEGGCVISPPQEESWNGTQILVSGAEAGSEENYVTASYNSDCRVYRSTYNDGEGSVSLEECEVSDIAVGDKVLLYGILDGKSISVSDVVIR